MHQRGTTRCGCILEFCAAHFLPQYKGNCANMHGHTYKVEISVTGRQPVVLTDRPVDPKTAVGNMVVDFKILKTDVQIVIDQYDHRLINDMISMPTAENIAQAIYSELAEQYFGVIVKLWESPNTYVEVY